MKVHSLRWRAHGVPHLLARVPRFPLGITLLTTVALLLFPSLLLRRFPRPQAIGLEKLLANVSLLQSFRPYPDGPVPQLWKERLGVAPAEKLWRLQTRTWWQFWDGHDGGRAYLALPSRSLPEAFTRHMAAPHLSVGNLTIFPPDLSSLQILGDHLQPQVRRSVGLRQRCVPRLEREEAVYWRPSGLGDLLGPLAPFLQNFQEGCLSLKIQPDGLSWVGEAASIEGMVMQHPFSRAEAFPVMEMEPPHKDVLLDIRGPSLEQLLSGLLARELIRQPLAERYGLGPQQVMLLRETPFRLLLRPEDQGPFKASIDLVVGVGNKKSQWQTFLKQLTRSLGKEGLKLQSSGQESTVQWRRNDGVVVGGWQWIPGTPGQIHLFLGGQSPSPTDGPTRELQDSAGMVLLARPRDLAERGLLPPELPEVVQRSRWLWVTAAPPATMGKIAPVSQLEGALLLRP